MKDNCEVSAIDEETQMEESNASSTSLKSMEGKDIKITKSFQRDEEKGLDKKKISEDNEVMESPMIGEVLDFEKMEEPAFTITYMKQHKPTKSRVKARKSTTKKSIANAEKRKLDFKYGEVKIGPPSLAHNRDKKKIKGEESASNC
ncbi:hypothetical protein COLO4_37003 [Corchorus olitorius]|uniref:Uncharacterized protein n=1 Tax=Corchorus olitorius TaxID=93759 RepID=A0A1R3G3U7_9ROSI|nr:hypothetical protein COLO4_37003 [Corchorus olitorius]